MGQKYFHHVTFARPHCDAEGGNVIDYNPATNRYLVKLDAYVPKGMKNENWILEKWILYED